MRINIAMEIRFLVKVMCRLPYIEEIVLHWSIIVSYFLSICIKKASNNLMCVFNLLEQTHTSSQMKTRAESQKIA